MWITVLLFIPILLYIYNHWAFGYWKRKGVFQLEGHFFFGNIRDILFGKRALPDVAGDIYKKYKEQRLIGLYSFYRPILLVTDPQLVKQVLVTDFNNFSAGGFEVDEKTDPMLAMNPFGTTNFELWKERRGMHVSLHTPSKLKLVPAAITKVGNNMIDYILQSPNMTVNVKELAQFFTLDSIVSSGLGLEPQAFLDPNSLFAKNVKEIFTPKVDTAFTCAYLYPFIGRLLSMRVLTPECQKFFEELTPQLLSQREKSSINRGDVLDVILKMDKKKISEGKKGLGNLEKTAHLVAALLDSYFTTSLILQAFILDLAENPEEQEKVRAEIADAGSKIEDFDTINSLKYLQMALNESLRMHTVLLLLVRACSKTTQLGEVTIDKGTKLLVPSKELHMDPDYYPEPEKYLPERFANDCVKGTFLPFGDGPRMCLGNRYAMLVIKLAIAKLLLKFKILPTKKGQESKNPVPENQIFGTDHENVMISFQPLNL